METVRERWIRWGSHSNTVLGSRSNPMRFDPSYEEPMRSKKKNKAFPSDLRNGKMHGYVKREINTPTYAKAVNKIPDKFFDGKTPPLTDEEYLNKIRKYIPKRTGGGKIYVGDYPNFNKPGRVVSDGHSWSWYRGPSSTETVVDDPLVPSRREKMEYCQECGWEIIENVAICERCGADLE